MMPSLSSDHWANRCKIFTTCAVCSRRHYTLLHPTDKDSIPPSVIQPPVVSTSLLSGFSYPSVVLGTALVHILARIPLVELYGPYYRFSWCFGCLRTRSGQLSCFSMLCIRTSSVHLILGSAIYNRRPPTPLVGVYSHLALADPDFHIAALVDLLLGLGSDLFSSITNGRQVVIDKSLPQLLVHASVGFSSAPYHRRILWTPKLPPCLYSHLSNN
ncbi:hypothetical protein AGLY_017270 [Aphis glycines]|uniref:Uncharacterized protein n=1 Tax=Aphis glycines TaxID=307491 RepID=A0A6G0SWJ2_APHGL|nr:hypothetical protein AGLY_017270 [Aphis glycines]